MKDIINSFTTLNDKLNHNTPITLVKVPDLDLKLYDELLSTVSSTSKFSDNKWIIDLLFKDRYKDDIKSLNFLNYNFTYANEYKEYALKQLISKRTVNTIKNALTSVNKFTSFLSNKPMIETTENDIMDFYSFLFGNNHINMSPTARKKCWVETRYYMTVMGYDNIGMIMHKYNIPNIKPIQADRYIPEEIATQIDLIFKRNSSIPITFQFMYWTLRLLVNRISEVQNCKDDCLKQFSEDTYTISIPTYKQEGPYSNTTRMIYIKDEDIGHFYINIVKATIKTVKKCNSRESNLLCYKPKTTYKWDEKSKELLCIEYPHHKNSWSIVTRVTFNKFLKLICKEYGIKDSEGNIYKPSSHCFRHNSITDRINSGIFRDVDIQAMSFHANTVMINKAYYHPNTVNKQINNEVFFKGRIVSNENDKEERILKRPFAMRIRNLGICSDTRACNKDKTKCLFCEHMIPDYDKKELYIEERDTWIKKKELAISTMNKDYEELCNQWIDGYNVLITKIESINNVNEVIQ